MVIGLFGLMNVGAVAGFALDAHERRSVLAKLQTEELGYRVTPDGTWVWRFSVDPLQGEQGVPTGTAVALAELLGVPYSRLRAALPDDLVSFGMGDVMGRRSVLSVTAMDNVLAQQLSAKRSSKARRKGKREAAAPEWSPAAPIYVAPSSATRRTLMTTQLDDGPLAVTPRATPPRDKPAPPSATPASANAKQSRFALVLAEAEDAGAEAEAAVEAAVEEAATAAEEAEEAEPQAAAGDDAGGDCVLAEDIPGDDESQHEVPDYGQPKQAEQDAPAADDDVLEELLGTALVLAFLQVGALMPVVELARCRAAATRFFDGVTVRVGSALRLCKRADSPSCRPPRAGRLRRRPSTWSRCCARARSTALTAGCRALGSVRPPRRVVLLCLSAADAAPPGGFAGKLIMAQNTEGWWDATRCALIAAAASFVRTGSPLLHLPHVARLLLRWRRGPRARRTT